MGRTDYSFAWVAGPDSPTRLPLPSLRRAEGGRGRRQLYHPPLPSGEKRGEVSFHSLAHAPHGAARSRALRTFRPVPFLSDASSVAARGTLYVARAVQRAGGDTIDEIAVHIRRAGRARPGAPSPRCRSTHGARRNPPYPTRSRLIPANTAENLRASRPDPTRASPCPPPPKGRRGNADGAAEFSLSSPRGRRGTG